MNTYTGEIRHFNPGDMIPEEYKPILRSLTNRETHKMRIDKYAPCGCGSGKKFKFCCYKP